MSDKSERAEQLYTSGFNCAQSVLAVFCEQYGLDEATALKLSSGMGGGCRSGELCGAALGGTAVLGLKDGQCELSDTDARARCTAQTIEFMRKFGEKNKGLTCRDIVAAIKAGEAPTAKPCGAVVTGAVETLEDMGY